MENLDVAEAFQHSICLPWQFVILCTASWRWKSRKKVEKTVVLQRTESIEMETMLTYRADKQAICSASGWNRYSPMPKCCSPKALHAGLHRCASCSFSSMFPPLFSSSARHFSKHGQEIHRNADLLRIPPQYPKGHFLRMHRVVRESPPWQVVVRWFSNVWLRLVYLSCWSISRVVRQDLDIQNGYHIPVLAPYRPHIPYLNQSQRTHSFSAPLCIIMANITDLISYCWYNPQPMRNDHWIAGATIL